MKKRSPVNYRRMSLADIPAVQRLEAESFPSIPADKHWKADMLEAHVRRFPDGQFVAEIGGWVVASATSLMVPLQRALTPHTWREITGGGYLTTHDENADALYLTEIMVHPDARRAGIARRLYRMRQELARQRNLRALVSGGRIPGYDRFADKMSAVEYVKGVLDGDRGDRTLSAQLAAGFSVAGIMRNYITDPKSRDHATIIVWWNLDWEPAPAR